MQYLWRIRSVPRLTYWGRDKMARHFPDDIFKWIFLNENVWISINISLKFVRKGPINNIPTIVQVMAWRWPGDKPLCEPMMVRLLMHICVTRPQWVNETCLLGPYITSQLCVELITTKKSAYIFYAKDAVCAACVDILHLFKCNFYRKVKPAWIHEWKHIDCKYDNFIWIYYIMFCVMLINPYTMHINPYISGLHHWHLSNFPTCSHWWREPGPWSNIKMSSYQ